MSGRIRCSVASQGRGEALAGTASTVRAFLLVEAPGAWGVDAVGANGLPAPVRRTLAARAARHRVRMLMIRRHGRSVAGPLRVFTAFADPLRPRLETTTVPDAEALPDLPLDLSALRAGGTAGLDPHDAALFLVCTHGRHDVCCAERGRPVAAALARHAPDATWEVSHIGGDRFAGNLLVLPSGLYYGRLTPRDAVGLVDGHLAGHLAVEHLRGRSSYPFAVQAAEIHLLRATGRTGLNSFALLGSATDGEVTTALFAGDDGTRWQVRVRTDRAAPELLTCRSTRSEPAPSRTAVSVTSV